MCSTKCRRLLPSYKVNRTKSEDEIISAIIPLFSSAVMVCSEKYPLSAEEKAFVDGVEYSANSGNSKSRSDAILQQPELAGVNAFVQRQIASYTQKLLKLEASLDLYVTQSWLNRAEAGQFHPQHSHPNSLLSGVMFLSNEGKHPPIRFHRAQPLFPLELKYTELNDFNASCRWFEPVCGQLILFPSSLLHDVAPNTTDSARVTLSFNSFIRGEIGSADSLTSLTI